MKRLATTLSVLLLPMLLLAESITGRVVGVSDGDTINLLVVDAAGRRQQVRVRLHGVDAPESGQPFSAASRKFTSNAVFDQTVKVQVTDTDRYGRKVGLVNYSASEIRKGERVTVKKVLNYELVQAGLAWWYERHARNDRTLQRLQKEARGARRGLWQDQNPVAPWDWRSRNRAS